MMDAIKKKKLTLVGSFVTLAIVIIALLLAVAAAFPHTFGWFANNITVNGQGMTVALEGDKFVLAVRDAEYAQMYTDSSYTGIKSYLNSSGDIYTQHETGAHTGLFSLITNTDNGEISPGSYGEMLFYVIPKDTAELELDFTLDLRGVAETVSNNTPVLSEVTDEEVLNLLKGHIMFFFTRTSHTAGTAPDVETYYTYSDMINGSFSFSYNENDASQTITVNGTDISVSGQSISVDNRTVTGYPVHLYWVWPATYGQMAYAEGSANLNGHALFASQTDIRAYMTSTPEYFFYSYSDPNKDFAALMGQYASHFTDLSEGYNDGDQKIGESVRYFVPTFTASPVESQN